MFSNIFLNKQNLLKNVTTLKEIAGGELCVMVKANAYGHGSREIAEMLADEVNYFGVSNEYEAFDLREMTDKNIIVFGRCEDYATCTQNDIAFSLFSLAHTKEIVENTKHLDKKPLMHLCINSGMNRYGVREVKECKKIILYLQKKGIELSGIYTHFSSLTTDEKYTQKQYEIFKKFCSLIPQNWKTKKHLGGGKSIFGNFDADMYRVGFEVYGYGDERVNPVLSVQSKIVDVQKVKAGEHIGYLCGYTAEKDMKVATIPLGYGDGLPRKLSNKFSVTIKGRQAKSVGNICMDAFMVDVSEINCGVGDDVIIFDDARKIAPIIESTEYEVLTNLCKFRGDRKIR